ncbi:hypothetical protein ACLK1S_23910 [Escherichia coli]
MDAMKYNDLRDFLTLLEQQGEATRITLPVDLVLQITEIATAPSRAGGPALLFENPRPTNAGAVNLFRYAKARGDGHGAGRCFGAA